MYSTAWVVNGTGWQLCVSRLPRCEHRADNRGLRTLRNGTEPESLRAKPEPTRSTGGQSQRRNKEGTASYSASSLQALSYGRPPPAALVNGVLRTPDGVVTLRPKAMLRLRNAVTLLKLLVRAPPLTVAGKPIDDSKMENLAATETSMTETSNETAAPTFLIKQSPVTLGSPGVTILCRDPSILKTTIGSSNSGSTLGLAESALGGQ